MKKIFVCLMGVVAMTLTATAQEKAVWGVRAGVNVTNMAASSGDVNKLFSSKVGFNVGVSYQQPLVSKLFLETGLNLTSRGAKLDASKTQSADPNVKFNMLYLQLPVAISWHFDVKSVSLQPYVGAYYGLGISGKVKAAGREGDIFKKTTIDGEEVPAIAKRSDVGLRFGLGVAIHKHYYVGLGYDMGLTNIAKGGEDAFFGSKVKNRSFYVSLGYNF